MLSRTSSNTLLIAVIFVLLNIQMALAADQYGAIAYDYESGVYGYSSQYLSQEDAEIMALQACEDELDGDDGECTVELWFKNAYGSLAEGDDGFGTGWGSNKNESQYQAIQVCEEHTENCDITLTVAAE